MNATGSPPRPASMRRRLLALSAVAAVLPLAALRQRAGRRFSWQGIALGAPASITLYHHDGDAARAAIDAALRELARVEAIFSLFRADSWIARAASPSW